MLEDDEYVPLWSLYTDAIRAAKALPGPLDEDARAAVFGPFDDAHERVTGSRDSTAFVHHRLSNYGPPCVVCGKPLRTPKATYCAACGAARWC